MAENKNNKYLARKAYGERQIDKWVKWSWANTGRISWRELVKKQNEFNIGLINKCRNHKKNAVKIAAYV